MKHLNKILLVALALMAATLFASSTDARKNAGTAAKDRTVSIRVPDELKPDGFEMKERDGKVVGMALVKKDGSRMDLTQKPKPARDTVCPAGTTMVCYYGETTYYCFCYKPGGGGGGGALATLHSSSSY